MEYVKGCDVIVMTGYTTRKFDSGKMVIADGLDISVEDFKAMVETANGNFINPQGIEQKGVQAGLVYALFKKVDKQKVMLGYCYIERVGGVPTDKTGLAKMFANSTDTYRLAIRDFVAGFEKEEQYFDDNIVSHLKSCVGLGQVMAAEYGRIDVVRNEKNKVLAIALKLGYFVFMAIVWSWIFDNIGVGILFGLTMSLSFNTIIGRVKAKEKGSLQAG